MLPLTLFIPGQGFVRLARREVCRAGARQRSWFVAFTIVDDSATIAPTSWVLLTAPSPVHALDGSAIQQAVSKVSGVSTVPQVFIDGL